MTASPLDALVAEDHTLGNGLRLVVAPMPGVHRVVVDASLRVGSRFESRTNNGISHFLEHVLYRGTPRHPSAHAQAHAFERLGGTLVAATATDHGSMAISVPPESFEETLDLFAEVYREPTLEGIDVEKGIVREEINETLDDDGKVVDADELVRALAFDEHPLGFPITGTLELLDRFDRSLLAAHHSRHYVASQTVLAVAGPVDPDTVFALAERHFGALAAGAPPAWSPPPDQHEPRFRFVDHHASSQTDVRLAFRAPGEGSASEPAVDLLLRVLDDGMSTRLYQRLCDARGLCYDVSAGYEAWQDSGIVEIAASAAHERAGDVLEELLSVVRELRDDGATDEEIDKAKRRHRWEAIEMLDDPGSVAEFYTQSRLIGGAKTPLERDEQIAAVTKAELADAASRVFMPGGLSTVAVGVQSKRAREALQSRVLAA